MSLEGAATRGTMLASFVAAASPACLIAARNGYFEDFILFIAPPAMVWSINCAITKVAVNSMSKHALGSAVVVGSVFGLLPTMSVIATERMAPPSEFRIWCAALLMVSGVSLRVYSERTLGNHFSHALRLLKQHRLVTTGVFSIIRHPAYLGTNLSLLSLCAYSGSVYSGMVLAGIQPLGAWRIIQEEQMLQERFGPEFERYKLRTNRIIPGVW